MALDRVGDGCWYRLYDTVSGSGWGPWRRGTLRAWFVQNSIIEDQITLCCEFVLINNICFSDHADGPPKDEPQTTTAK